MLTIVHAVDDFNDSKINEIIKSAQSKECAYYHSLFHKELVENLTLQNSEKEILQLLSVICSFFPSEKSLYDSAWHTEEKRSLNTEDLTEFDLSFLKSIIENISDDELRSRIADILWIKKKDYKSAKIAIISFLKSGRNFLKITSDRVPEVNQFFKRFERATQISLSINDNFRIKQISKYLKCRLEKAPQPFKNDYLIECLLNLLKLTGTQDEFCLKFIENNLDKLTNTHDRGRICDIGAEVAKKLKQQEKVNNFYRYKAKNLYEEATRFAAENNYIGAHSWMVDALDALKKINPILESDKLLKAEWETILTEFNIRTSDNMSTFSTEVDATLLIQESNRKLEIIKKYQSNAIATLALFTKDPIKKYNESMSEAEKSLQDSLIQFVSTSYFDKDKKEIKSSNSTKDAAIRNLNFYWSLSCDYIEKVRNHIIQTFDSKSLESAIFSLIKDNPLISPERVQQVFTGVYYGFYGEWIVSSHVIPSQIENILRARLKISGHYKLKTKDDLTQQERDMNELLSDGDYRNFLNKDEYLDIDTLFNLEALLIHKHGENLRNDCYHGLCEDNFFTKSSNIYLWWLFLKIIVEAKLKSVAPSKESNI